MWNKNYFVYILTNYKKTVLYTGVTGNLVLRLQQHRDPGSGSVSQFTTRYNCFYLIYFERHYRMDEAIMRETQIKGWKRKKKMDLISSQNINWKFLNNEVGDDIML